MASTPVTSPSGSRETLWAIIGSFVLSLILATILAGNPFRALSLAYFDYSHEPGAAAGKAMTPAATTPPAAPK